MISRTLKALGSSVLLVALLGLPASVTATGTDVRARQLESVSRGLSDFTFRTTAAADEHPCSGRGVDNPATPPVTPAPVTSPPVTSPPVTTPPVTTPPVTKPPVTKPPVTKPPVSKPGVNPPSHGANAIRKIGLGVSMVPGSSLENNLKAYNAYKSAVGRPPATWSIWSDWGFATNREFPTGPIMKALKNDGTTPLIFWQPVGPTADYSRMKVIANGAYDTYIQRFAQDVKAFGKPVILRFAQEMDGGWFPWGDSRYDNTPRLFVKAWRHIVKIFQNEGAGNARFLWNPLSPNVNEGLYPGDAYVSYVGFTFFNWADNSHPWKGMLAGYSGRYAGMRRITSKPIIVAETGSAPDKWGNSRAAWVADGYPAVYAKLPGIKGIIYFSVDMSQDTHPPQPNWMLEGQSLNEYKLLVNQPRFKGTLK